MSYAFLDMTIVKPYRKMQTAWLLSIANVSYVNLKKLMHVNDKLIKRVCRVNAGRNAGLARLGSQCMLV